MSGGHEDGGAAVRLQTRGLAAGHGRTVVLAGVDLSLRAGQVTVLIGPNGGGKSTLLKTLARQLEPLGGAVRVDMGDVGGYVGDIGPAPRRDLARTMASLFTEGRRPELLTCRDVVEAGRYPFTGAFGGTGDADLRAVERAMGLLGVSDLADRDYTRISDGQRQRVLLARAVAQDPSVLILDEPTSFLDVRHQLDLLWVLRALAREQGVCVVASLHELALGQRVADQVVVVAQGRVVEVGPPEQVFVSEKIGAVYGLDGPLRYDPLFGSVEMPAPTAPPEVFVVAGGGSGAETFRRLAREGVPFATGVLHEGDVDCVLARDLGARVVANRAYEPIADDVLAEALALLESVANDGGACIDCAPPIGVANARNKELLGRARDLGILG